jgi:hypothetical protein
MDANEQIDLIGRSAMAAWTRIKKAQSRLWADWMVVGEGLMEGRRWAQHKAGVNAPEGKGYVVAYSEWLAKYRLADMDKSDRAKLLQLMDERPAVEEWRAGLTDWERRNLNNPIIVWRKWTAATRVKKPKPRTAGVSGAEHGRAKGIIGELQARNAELQEELDAMRAARQDGAQEPERSREIAQPSKPALEWEIEVDDDEGGYLSAYQEPFELSISQSRNTFFWNVHRYDTTDYGKDAVHAAGGEAPSLIAAMTAAEAAMATPEAAVTNLAEIALAKVRSDP